MIPATAEEENDCRRVGFFIRWSKNMQVQFYGTNGLVRNFLCALKFFRPNLFALGKGGEGSQEDEDDDMPLHGLNGRR